MAKTGDSRDPFVVIRQRIADLHWRWAAWKQLFVGDENRKYDLMNTSAHYLFRVIEEALIDNVVLGICKLADPPQGGPWRDRRDNLVLERFLDEMKASGDSREGAARDLLNTLREGISPLKRARDRAIAHRDFRTVLHVEPLDPIQYQTVDDSLKLVVRVAELIELPTDRPFMFDVLIAAGDGDALLRALDAAQRFDDLRLVLYWLQGLPIWAKQMKQKFPTLAAEFDNLPPSDVLETLRRNDPWPGAWGAPCAPGNQGAVQS
jgi:hypothetical protein